MAFCKIIEELQNYPKLPLRNMTHLHTLELLLEEAHSHICRLCHSLYRESGCLRQLQNIAPSEKLVYVFCSMLWVLLTAQVGSCCANVGHIA
jgi:hypothetical protein